MAAFANTTVPTVPIVPIGTGATGTRRESDSMGEIEVPAEHYWGAQTQRSLIHFAIGDDRMPKAVYHAYGLVKKAAALVNEADGRLEPWKAAVIARVADEVVAGELDAHFPLFVWQTGSGTQSNMNVNEVISNRAIQLLGGELGSKTPVHPNDDVNMGQSSNDSFPTAMHVAATKELDERLLPQLDALAKAIEVKSADWKDVVKVGRTHLEDAVPLTVGQEWSGYAHQIREAMAEVAHVSIGTQKGPPIGIQKGPPSLRLARSHGGFFVRLTGAVSSSRPDHPQGVARSRGQAWPQATAERRAACLTAASTAPASNKAGRRISRGSAGASSHRRARRAPRCKRFWFVARSIPAEAARRHDRLQLAEVKFADRAQCFGGRGILQGLRQVL
jgi:hypothetical protein